MATITISDNEYDNYDKSSSPGQSPAPSMCTIDRAYVRSAHGIQTLLILVISMLSFILIQACSVERYCAAGHVIAFNFLSWVVGSCFLTYLFRFILYLLSFNISIHRRLKFMPWHLWILIWCCVWSILLLLSSVITMAFSCGSAGIIIAALLGLATMAIVIAQGVYSYRAVQEELAREKEAQTTPDGRAVF